MYSWSFFCLFLKKNNLRKTIYLSLSILSIVLLSCKKNQGVIGNYSLFESKVYAKMDLRNKLVYLDSIYTHSNSLKNDALNRNFLFHLAAEYYYLNAPKKSFVAALNSINSKSLKSENNALKSKELIFCNLT